MTIGTIYNTADYIVEYMYMFIDSDIMFCERCDTYVLTEIHERYRYVMYVFCCRPSDKYHHCIICNKLLRIEI